MKSSLHMSKQALVRVGLIALFFLLTAAAGYYIFFVQLTATRFDVRKFSGNVIAVEGDTVTLRGMFFGSGEIPENLKTERDFSFRVGGATRFTKADIRWPTWEELAKQGTSGTFKIQDLPRVNVEGSLNDLKDIFLLNTQNVYVEAGFSASIHNSPNPLASFVFYQLIGIPSSSPTQSP